MQNSNKKRICIVTRSLGEGGADRVASLQSIFFSNLGYQVFIVSILNFTKYSYKGKLLNLGEIKEKDNTFLGRYKRFLIFKNFLKDNQVDIIIDHRVRKKIFSEAIISFFLYGKKAIYVIHNSKIDLYFPSSKWIAKLAYRNAKKIVAVSDEIKQQVINTYGFNNVMRIYNPIDFDDINLKKEDSVNLNYKYIFWYGRFEDKQKNLSLLINSYKHSVLPSLKIKLVLMGQGKDENKIIELIKSLNLNDDIKVLPFSINPFSYIKQAVYVVLSSRYEGFPMTVLESLACGKPVLSVKYGDSVHEIIKNKYNGLLVENNVEALSKGLNIFIQNKNLYENCKNNAILSVERFNMQNISHQWGKLIND